uniref:WAP four-disulfide core domain protein 18-like n=2 Tax=Nannospalax galili TaxID=1026970 RepID=A0A8C6RE93_NANGA
LQKPGVCPTVPPGTFGICVEKCSGDESCPKEMKCCSNGCGHVCKSPVFK